MNINKKHRRYLAIGISFIIGVCIGTMIGIDYAVNKIVTGFDGMFSNSIINVDVNINETEVVDAMLPYIKYDHGD